MPTDAVARSGFGDRGRAPGPASGRPAPFVIGISYDRILNLSLYACVASGAIAFIEPSPYDVLSLGLMALWFLGGFTIHRFVVPFVALIVLYNLGGFLALLPYLDEPDPTAFMEQSLYLTFAAIFFALFFAQNTLERTETCLKAFAFSTVVAAACAVMGYFDIGGTESLFTLWGRASGTFKDPNVLGSYLILGALYFIQTLILGRTRHVLTMLVSLLLVTAAIFLSFSRGSWAAFVVASLLTIGLSFVTTASRRVRRRIVLMTLIAVAVTLVGLVVLLSIESVRDLFVQRFALTQDYDTGETGRFGNQWRAIPMLMERINGFGPVRFRLFFDLDSHNSYLGAFSSYGWLGGGSFFLLVGLTVFIGFRLVLTPSPVQRVSQVVWPALFVVLAQGMQIDIDHWRHLYLMLGLFWGLETARRRGPERIAAPRRGIVRALRQPFAFAPAPIAQKA